MTLRRYSGVGDDVDPLVVAARVTRSRSMRWRAGPEHRVAVGLERSVEVGRLVGLDPIDDRLRRRRGRSRGPSRSRASRSSARRCQPSSRIASASRPSKARRPTIASWRSRPIAQSSVPSASVPSSQVAYSSTATLAARGGPLEAALLGRRQVLARQRRSRRRTTGSSAAVSISISCQRRTCGTVARVFDSSR